MRQNFSQANKAVDQAAPSEVVESLPEGEELSLSGLRSANRRLPVKDPRTLVEAATPNGLLAKPFREDANFVATPLGQKIKEAFQEANEGQGLVMVDNDQSYLEPLQELLALRGAGTLEGAAIQQTIDSYFRDGSANFKGLHFPYARTFSDLFGAAKPYVAADQRAAGECYLYASDNGKGEYASLTVTVHPEVLAGLHSLVGPSAILEAVRHENDGAYLLIAKSDPTLSNRWLCCLDAGSVEAALQLNKVGESKPIHQLPKCEPLEQKFPHAYAETVDGAHFLMKDGVRTRHESLAEATALASKLNAQNGLPSANTGVRGYLTVKASGEQARNGGSHMVKVTEDVRQVLLGATIEGNLLTLPGQLDKALYKRVDETLNLLGGKWTRGKGGHVFKGEDPAVLVAEALESGSIEDPTKKYQFYPTPKLVAQRLVKLADFSPEKMQWALEPSGGSGAILDEFPKSCSGIQTCEIQPELADALEAKGYAVEKGDFMAYHPGPIFERIVANPPFTRGQDLAHISHMLDCLAPGGRLVSVLSAGIDYRTDKVTKAFLARLQKECVFRFEDIESGAFRESGTLVNAKILIADKIA